MPVGLQQKTGLWKHILEHADELLVIRTALSLVTSDGRLGCNLLLSPIVCLFLCLSCCFFLTECQTTGQPVCLFFASFHCINISLVAAILLLRLSRETLSFKPQVCYEASLALVCDAWVYDTKLEHEWNRPSHTL